MPHRLQLRATLPVRVRAMRDTIRGSATRSPPTSRCWLYTPERRRSPTPPPDPSRASPRRGAVVTPRRPRTARRRPARRRRPEAGIDRRARRQARPLAARRRSSRSTTSSSTTRSTAASCAATSATSRRSTTSASTSGAARSSASSASRAVASRPSGKTLIRLQPPTPGRPSSTARTIFGKQGNDLQEASAAGCRSSSRTRRLAQPADAGQRHHRRGPARPGRHREPLGRPQGPRQAGRRLPRGGRPAARLRAPLSARVLRRPAPADRHRPGARARPGLRRLRRAGVGARRVDPEPDPEPARSTSGASSA